MDIRNCYDCSVPVIEINANTGNVYGRCQPCRERNNTLKLKYYHEHKERGTLPEDLTRVPYHLETYFRTKLSRWAHMPDWEDAVQEACIQAWKDEQKGLSNKSQIEARAVMRGKAIALFQTGVQGGSTMTGHVGRKSTEGVVRQSGALKREKIKNYIDEFQTLHDRRPTNVEIGNALGMDRSAVGKYVRKMYTSGVTVATGDVKLEHLYSSYDNSAESDDAAFVIERNPIQWESSTIDRLTVETLMSKLTLKQRKVVYLTHWLDMSTRQVGQEIGISAKNVREHLIAAYDRMRKAM